MAMLFVASNVLAEDIKGMLKKVDVARGTVTVTSSNNRDRTWTITEDTKIVGPGGKRLRARLKDKLFATGVEVLVTTEIRNDREVVTTLKITGEAKRDR